MKRLFGSHTSEKDLGSGGRPKKENGLSGAGYDILLPAVAATVPGLVLAGAVVWIVAKHRVEHQNLSNAYFPNATKLDDSNVYYIDYDSNRLITISSWASNTAALLPGFVMSLFWYHMAVGFRNESKSGTPANLPTPHHFSLLLAMKTGGIPPLWDWISHIFSRKRPRQSSLISSTGRVLTLATFSGALVWASDTWFHITTTSVNFDQLRVIQNPSQRYGRTLPPSCSIGEPGNCTSQTYEAVGPYLVNPLEVYQVLNNQSVVNQVATTFVTGRRLSYLAPQSPIPGLDYRASTLASQSKCTLITSNCVAPATIWEDKFHCSSLFSSNSSNQNVSAQANRNAILYAFFSDANGSLALDLDDIAPTNPFHTLFQISIKSTASESASALHGQFVSSVDGELQYYLGCETTLLNTTYTVVNGTVLKADTTILTNPHLIYSLIESDKYGDAAAQLINAGLTASLQNSSLEVVETFAEAYDATFLAPAASVSEQVLNIAEQQRTSLLVSRIQKSALFTFVMSLMASTLLGVTMAVLAIIGINNGSRDVQARLSILGLVSSRFEQPSISGARVRRLEESFEESKTEMASRIGILQNGEGGWNFESWAPVTDSTRISEEEGIPLVSLEDRGEGGNVAEREGGEISLPETSSLRTDQDEGGH